MTGLRASIGVTRSYSSRRSYVHLKPIMVYLSYLGVYECMTHRKEVQGIKPRTPGLSRQCSATELQQPDNYQFSICTAQVALNLMTVT